MQNINTIDLNRDDFQNDYLYLKRLTHNILKGNVSVCFDKFYFAIEDLLIKGSVKNSDIQEMKDIQFLIEEVIRKAQLSHEDKAKMKNLRKKFIAQLDKNVTAGKAK